MPVLDTIKDGVGKIKKWIISAGTITLIILAGYQLGDWDEERGYPVISPLGDTTWVSDSTRLTEVADSLSSIMDTFAIAVFKIGDQESETGKKDGQLVDVFDFKEQTPGFIFGKNNQKVYYCQKIPRSQIAFYRSKLCQTSEDVYVPPKAIFRYSKLPDSLKQIVSNKSSFKTVSVLVDTLVDFDNDALTPNAAREDLNSIASGDYTVGSDGDYALWNLGFTDLTNFTGDISLIQISDVSFEAATQATEQLNGNKFLLDSDTPHYGNYNNGWLTTIAGNNLIGFDFRMDGSTEGSSIEVRNLKITQTGGRAGAVYASLLATVSTDSFDISFHDNILCGNNLHNTCGIKARISQATFNIYNNVIYDYGEYGIWIDLAHSASIIENNTCYSNDVNGIFVTASTAAKIQNNLCVSNGTDYAGIAACTGTNNADSDSTGNDDAWVTGSGNICEVTIADEVVTTDSTSEDFMKLKDGSIEDAGATVSIAGDTLGIRGNARPGTDAAYSIGADEYDPGCGVSYDTIYRDTTRDSIRIKCDSAQVIYADSEQVDSIFCSDTISNWAVSFLDSILLDTVFVDYGPSYDTSYSDTAVQCSVCLENNKLVEFSGDSIHIDSICFEDTSSDWSVTWRDSIKTDTTDTPIDSVDGIQDTTVLVQWTIDTVVAPDTTYDTINTSNGDTTFWWSRDIVESCSTIYDSSRNARRVDTVIYVTNYCSGDTISTDSVGFWYGLVDTIVDVTDDLCGIVALDTAASPYDTTYAGKSKPGEYLVPSKGFLGYWLRPYLQSKK